MDEKDVIATLCKLEEMDRDAVRVYEDAIAKTADPQVRDQLDEFRKDHARHAQAIDGVIREQGWRHPEATQEFQTLMQAFRQQVDMAEGGDDAVLLAMDLGEKATNAEYAEALRMDVDPRIVDVLERDLADEERHLAFVEEHMPRSFGGGPLGNLQVATTGDGGTPYTEATGGAGAYGGMGGDVGPGGGGTAEALEHGTREATGGADVSADYGIGSSAQGQHLQGSVPAAGRADTSTERSRPRGGLNADVREGIESKGSEMAGGGTGANEEHPNIGGQVEGDSESSGSGVAGSGSGD